FIAPKNIAYKWQGFILYLTCFFSMRNTGHIKASDLFAELFIFYSRSLNARSRASNIDDFPTPLSPIKILKVVFSFDKKGMNVTVGNIL
ncbi:hypothetical protein M8827_09625, partial [Aeromonas simiae]